MTADVLPTKAGKREWIGLGVLALTVMLVAFDFFVLVLALPHLSADLGADGIEQLWIVDIYGFLVGGFMITMGGLGDRIGRRKLLLIGAAAFGAASLLAAYSTSPEMLIIARVLLGIAGATLAPSTLSLVSNMFRDPKQLGLAVGVWAASFTAGAVLGPVAGGILLSQFWWGSVFLIGVPVILLLLVLGPVLLPEYRNPDAGRLDLVSAVMSLAAILPCIYGIKEIAKYGFVPLPAAAVVVGVVFAVLFVRRQRRLADPLLDVDLFRIPDFRIGMVGLLAYALLSGGVMLLMAQWFQSVANLSPLQAGLALLPGMAAATVSSMLAPILARRIRPAVIIGVGLLVVAVILVLFTQVGPDTSPLVLVLGWSIWCLGGGPTVALGMGLVLAATPPEKAGAAAAMPQVGNELGAAVGFAVIGTIATAVYRGQMSDAVPSEVPAGAAEAIQESVASAATAAGSLPESLGAAVLDPAREAFTDGLQITSGIAGVLLAVVAVVVMVKLRHVSPLGAESADASAAGASAEAA